MTLIELYFGQLVTDDTIIHISGKDWWIRGHWYEDGVSYAIHKHKKSAVKRLTWMDRDGNVYLYVTVVED